MNSILDVILSRSRAARTCFLDETGHPTRSGEIVLAHLKRFCRADRPTVVISKVMNTVDPLAMAMAEGRREVWLRLMEMLHLDEHQIAKLKEHERERDTDAA